MKPSKTGWIIIISSAFVIAIVSLAVILFYQVKQHTHLDERLAQTQTSLEQTRLTQLSSDKAELETRLNELTSRLEGVQGIFSTPIGSSTVTKALFDIAEVHQMEVTEMASSAPTEENLQEIDFSQILLTAHVEGDAANMVNFIIDLNNHFSTGVIKSVNVTITENNGVERAALDIDLTIYTHKGK